MICPCCFEDIAVAHACKAPDANPANLNRIYAEMQRLHLQNQELQKEVDRLKALVSTVAQQDAKQIASLHDRLTTAEKRLPEQQNFPAKLDPAAKIGEGCPNCCRPILRCVCNRPFRPGIDR